MRLNRHLSRQFLYFFPVHRHQAGQPAADRRAALDIVEPPEPEKVIPVIT